MSEENENISYPLAAALLLTMGATSAYTWVMTHNLEMSIDWTVPAGIATYGFRELAVAIGPRIKSKMSRACRTLDPKPSEPLSPRQGTLHALRSSQQRKLTPS